MRKVLLGIIIALGLAVVPLPVAPGTAAPSGAPYSTTLTNDNCTLTATYSWDGFSTTDGTYTAYVEIAFQMYKGKDAYFSVAAPPNTATVDSATGWVTTSVSFSGTRAHKFQALGWMNSTQTQTGQTDVVKTFRCGS